MAYQYEEQEQQQIITETHNKLVLCQHTPPKQLLLYACVCICKCIYKHTHTHIHTNTRKLRIQHVGRPLIDFRDSLYFLQAPSIDVANVLAPHKAFHLEQV